MMHRAIPWVAVLIFMSLPAGAQRTPKADFAAVFGVIPGTLGGSCVGEGGVLAFNLSDWIGITGEFNECSVRRTSDLLEPGPLITRSQFTYLIGPRFSYRSPGRLTPYAQALVGGVHGRTYIPMSALRGSAFALSAGLGLDLRINDRFGVRLVQPEYLMTRFGGVRRGDLRLQTGVLFFIR
jgi:hypothetical protein